MTLTDTTTQNDLWTSRAKVYDTLLIQHLLQPDLPHDLEFVASIFSNKPAWKHEGKGEPWYWELRCCRDCDATLQAGKYLVPKAKLEKVWDLYENVSEPLALICKLMQETGFKVDPNRIGVVRERLLGEMADEETYLPESLRTHDVPVRKRVDAPAGALGKSGKPVKYTHVESTEQVVPWRSTKTVQKYLYEELKLAPQVHAKSGRITSDKTALEKLYRRTKRRELLAVLKLRKKDELITTFCKDTMQKMSRMHPHFNVHGTNSGRLSSSDPNLQNIPEAARVIYVPSHPDWVIVEADYSQGENRLVAHFAGDTERLVRLSKPGFSEHKHNAGVFFGIPYDEVEKDNDKDAPYGKAKRITHGVGYGMGALKIAKLYDLDTREVKDLLYKWKLANPLTVKWQEEIGKKAHDDGVLVNPFGRKRWFYTNSFYTEALSFLPQSTLADIIFRALIGLMYERINWAPHRALKASPFLCPLPQPARLLVQVHDSLVIETPRVLLDQVVSSVTRVMSQPWRELGGYSIPVEVKVGSSWGECEPYYEPQVRLQEAA